MLGAYIFRKLRPGGLVSKESSCSAGYLGSIPGLGRSPGEGNGNPLQYSCLGNPMDKGAWQTTVHGTLQARILGWAAVPFSRGSSQLRDQTQVSCIAGRFFIICATREVHLNSLGTSKFKIGSQAPYPQNLHYQSAVVWKCASCG